MFAATEGGVFRSTDGGVNWSTASNGISNGEITVLKGDDKYFYAGTWAGGVFRSDDDGITWKDVKINSENQRIKDIAIKAPYLFVTAGSANYINRSTDNGLSWETKNTGVGSIDLMAVLGQNIFGAAEGKITRSTDNGESWNLVYQNSDMKYIRSFFSRDSIIYAGSNSTDFSHPYTITQIVSSTDAGASWANITNELSNVYLNGMGKFGPYLLAASGTGLYRSSDNGKNWKRTTSLMDGRISIICSNGKNLFGGSIEEVLISTDMGESWSDISDGITESYTHIMCLYVKGTNLFAGTTTGLWKRPLSEITGVSSKTNNAPSFYSLNQNYPNPFNPVTNITFSLPLESYVTLKVYDVLGKEVAALVNEKLNRGNYSRQFNASGLSSGVYFYRLQAGSFTETKRLNILK